MALTLPKFQQDGTGAVNRDVEDKLKEFVSVEDFGADPTGLTDSTNAFNAAIAYLNTIAYSATLVLRGNFVINGSLTSITTTRKVIDAYGATINHDGGTLFTFSTGGNGGLIKGLRYICPGTPTPGTCLVAWDGANVCELRDITGLVNQLAKVGLTAFVGGYFIRNVNVSTVNGTQTVIDHGSGAVSQINNLVMTSIGINRVLDETTLTNATATAIKFSGAWDTAIWSGLLINGYLYGLDINRTTANVNISNGRVTNFYFDFCANGIRLKNTAAGGGINNWLFTNGWVVGMDGYGVLIDGGILSTIKFHHVQAMLAGKNNWRIASNSTYSDIHMEDCDGQFANRLNGTNTGLDQDDFVALVGNFKVTNCRFGRSADGFVASGVPNWQGRYGATIVSNIGPYLFEGNTLEGRTSAAQISTSTTTPAGSARSCSVFNNRTASGASAISYATTSVIVAPTSAAVQTNLTPLTMRMYIYDGTVTQVQHEGIAIAGANGTSFILKPGETWSVYYSVAPTITRVVMP